MAEIVEDLSQDAEPDRLSQEDAAAIAERHGDSPPLAVPAR
jgi:hypothetical protein